jgi:hypothetical protein
MTSTETSALARRYYKHYDTRNNEESEGGVSRSLHLRVFDRNLIGLSWRTFTSALRTTNFISGGLPTSLTYPVKARVDYDVFFIV